MYFLYVNLPRKNLSYRSVPAKKAAALTKHARQSYGELNKTNKENNKPIDLNKYIYT